MMTKHSKKTSNYQVQEQNRKAKFNKRTIIASRTCQRVAMPNPPLAATLATSKGRHRTDAIEIQNDSSWKNEKNTAEKNMETNTKVRTKRWIMHGLIR